MGRKSNKMSAEERNAKMSQERAFLTSLLESSLAGDTAKVQGLIRQCSNDNQLEPHEVVLNFKDGSKRNALHFACLSQPKDDGEQDDSTDIVEAILTEFGFPSSVIKALITSQDDNGMTPLMLSCQSIHHRSYHRIKSIIDLCGVQVTMTKSKVGGTALHYAASAGAPREVISFLANSGKAAVNLLSDRSGTPLHWASGVEEDFSDTLEALLECGADVNATNKTGVSPLILAAASGNDVHCRVLVKHGAKRDFVLSGNNSVYHIAADMNQIATLKTLIEVDATNSSNQETISSKCLNLKNDNGETPLDLAVQGGHIDCVMLLSNETNKEKAKMFMEMSQREWKEIKSKKLNQEDYISAQPTASNDPLSEDAAKALAQEILSKAGSVSEVAKRDAANFKTEGNSFFAKKEWQLAIGAYTNAINSNPADATFYSNRSAAYMSAEMFDNALYDATMTRYLRPEWAKGCYRMAIARLALEKFEDAAVSAFEGLQIDEKSEELKSLLQKCIKKGRKQHLLDKKESNDEDNRENVMAVVT